MIDHPGEPDDRIEALGRHLAAQIAALDRHLTAEIAALRRETEAANANAERAIRVAAHEATERLQQHNGLIEQMRALQATFATRDILDAYRESTDMRLSRIERFQAMLTGGIVLLGTIGVANLVKAFLS
jgi:primosomal protein N''